MKSVIFNAPRIPAGKRTLFLHGFPAVRSKQNRYYAEMTAQTLNRECTVLLYDGLGFAPGVFSFDATLANVENFFESYLTQTSDAVDIVGHSWGGFMALKLAGQFGARIKNLVLMSPLLYFAEVSRSQASFNETAAANPHLSLGDLVGLATDFAKVGQQNPANELIQTISPKINITYLQAKVDALTPPEYAHSAQAFFAKPPRFELLDTDHSFLLNREENAKRIMEGLNYLTSTK
jgi:pimeloyl-ACP methyl ester carboxylesterase